MSGQMFKVEIVTRPANFEKLKQELEKSVSPLSPSPMFTAAAFKKHIRSSIEG